MQKINEELKNAIIDANQLLLKNYDILLSNNKNEIRKKIIENFNSIKKQKSLTPIELEKIDELGGIVGVDGSNNKMGGAEPHFIEIYQGLAKSTKYSNKPILKSDYYTPLKINDNENILEEDEEITNTKIRRKKLVDVELDVAIESIDKLKPYIIMMDGSLLRYKIESKDKWEILKNKCEDEGIILIGIVEDIKTSTIGDAIKINNSSDKIVNFYDREILYGLLEYGELIEIPNNPEISKKYREGISSAFVKTSTDPSVIAIDIPESQKENLEEMIKIVLALTPKDSRGIPIWLDIVDNEVRIEDRMIKGVLESFMDRRILEIFFKAERDKRIF